MSRTNGLALFRTLIKIGKRDKIIHRKKTCILSNKNRENCLFWCGRYLFIFALFTVLSVKVWNEIQLDER